MRKTAKQSEIFSELHNTRFADLLVKHIESTGDRSDFDWIPNRLKEQVGLRIINAPEQLTMLIAQIPHFNLKYEEITVTVKVKRAEKLSSKYSLMR